LNSKWIQINALSIQLPFTSKMAYTQQPEFCCDARISKLHADL
jgi:hypothetical protein